MERAVACLFVLTVYAVFIARNIKKTRNNLQYNPATSDHESEVKSEDTDTEDEDTL